MPSRQRIKFRLHHGHVDPDATVAVHEVVHCGSSGEHLVDVAPDALRNEAMEVATADHVAERLERAVDESHDIWKLDALDLVRHRERRRRARIRA